MEAAVPVPVRASVEVEGWALLVTVNVALADPTAVGLNVIVKGTLCPAGIVTGNESPLIVNAELFVPAAVTVTLAPLAFKLPEAVPLEPSTTLPTASVEGEILSCPATAVPVPVRVSVEVEGWALLVTVNVALADPTAVGLNVIVNGTLCPAGIVTGSDSPLIVKAELFVLAAVTVTLAPLAFKLPEPVPLPPLTTLPMASVDGEILSCPTAAVPVPVSVPVEVDGWPLLVTVSVALADPTAVGLNVIVKGTLCPAAIVTGSESPLIVNAELVILVAETVTLAPLADRLPEAVPLEPSTTLPTASVEGEMLSCPATAVPVPVRVSVEVAGCALLVTVSVALADPTLVG